MFVVFIGSFVEFFAGNKTVVSGKIVEEAVIIGALPIFQTLELNLSGLLLFGFVDFLPSVGDIERVDRVDDEEL